MCSSYNRTSVRNINLLYFISLKLHISLPTITNYKIGNELTQKIMYFLVIILQVWTHHQTVGHTVLFTVLDCDLSHFLLKVV